MQVSSNVSITTIHHNLPLNVSKRVVKSVIGSLNATAIAYARGYLRFNAMENGSTTTEVRGYKRPARPDEKHVDDFNEAENAIAESKFRNEVVSPDMGSEVVMPSDQLAEILMAIRGYFADFLNQHKSVQNDVPLTIAETVKFQMNARTDNNDEQLEALADAIEVDVEELKATKLQMVADDIADLKANAGKVITFLERFETGGADERTIERLFDTLPAHAQYKLMSAAIRAHEKAQKKSLMEVLRGKLDGAGDIKMLKGHRAELLTWLVTFSRAKRVQLDAYLDRGGMLMEIEDRTIVTSEADKPHAAAIPQSPIAPIGSCEVKSEAKLEPKAKGPARRAPKPETV